MKLGKVLVLSIFSCTASSVDRNRLQIQMWMTQNVFRMAGLGGWTMLHRTLSHWQRQSVTYGLGASKVMWTLSEPSIHASSFNLSIKSSWSPSYVVIDFRLICLHLSLQKPFTYNLFCSRETRAKARWDGVSKDGERNYRRLMLDLLSC